MKLKFLSLAILLSVLFFPVSSSAVFYGICCPDCPEGQEAKEISTDNCKCVCNQGETVRINNNNAICCEGANNVVAGKIDQNCCEKNAKGKYVGNGGQGFPEACCIEGSSKDTNGDLNPTCCKEAGGAIRNGKCCRQSPQGS